MILQTVGALIHSRPRSFPEVEPDQIKPGTRAKLPLPKQPHPASLFSLSFSEMDE